jgi:DNA polymerase-3 subunit epsilon
LFTSTLSHRDQVIALAQQKLEQKPVYIDTETTGLNRSDEIIEISIIDHDGTLLFSKLVKPSQPIPKEPERIHGISNDMVRSAQAWPTLWPVIRNHLYGRVIAAYNAPFDSRMMEQSHARYHLPWREKMVFLVVLTLFSEYRGEWDQTRGSYRFFKLEEAGVYFKIPLPNAHRSTADALLTRAVLHCIAGKPY